MYAAPSSPGRPPAARRGPEPGPAQPAHAAPARAARSARAGVRANRTITHPDALKQPCQHDRFPDDFVPSTHRPGPARAGHGLRPAGPACPCRAGGPRQADGARGGQRQL
ncbi:hypothetical protein CBM2585_A40119 [Cupriavidus taiwanensis]|nr:hypothetical protein CBM2585_A40119 [Cupriavidus taiwanensis]